MNNFIVTYATGLKQEIQCGLESIELFCNQHFGSTWDDAAGNGATIEMIAVDVEDVAKVVAEIAPLVAPEVAVVATVVEEVAETVAAEEKPAE